MSQPNRQLPALPRFLVARTSARRLRADRSHLRSPLGRLRLGHPARPARPSAAARSPATAHQPRQRRLALKLNPTTPANPPLFKSRQISALLRRHQQEASEGVVLRVLANLKNGRIEDALVGFAEEFRFKDHGIGLEFKDKQRLAEFFYKTRELYPDSVLHTDTIFDADNRVITEWTLRFTLREPFYGALKRTLKVFVHGASIVRIENTETVERNGAQQ